MVVLDPHAVATRYADPLVRAIAALSVVVAERPWAVTSRDLEAARAAGLSDPAILHAVLQASLFGHLNRIADAVGVDADYPDRFRAPRIEPATPPYLRPPAVPALAQGPIGLGLIDGIAERLAAWSAYVRERDTPIDRRRRSVIRHAVASSLGDASVPAESPADELDHALVVLSDVVTLSPWRLGPPAYERVRELGLADDAAVFDVVATSSSFAVASRIAVVLAGFAVV